MSEQVVIIGVDGASLQLLDPWIQSDYLPTFRKFKEQGSFGELESTIHPMSAQAWMSLCTGKNPAAHGVIDFMILEPGAYTMKFANSSHIGSPALWDIVSRFGKTAGIINIPITFPPPRVNGYLLAGMGAPGTASEFVHPPELRRKILSRFPNYIIELGTWGYAKRGDRDGMLHSIKAMLETRFATLKFLLKNNPTDLTLVVIRATDEVQHHFWRFLDHKHPLYEPSLASRFQTAILDIYRRVDEMIDELSYLLPDATIILVSDHGSGANGDRAIYLNSFLAKQGYLTFDSARLKHRVIRSFKFFLRKHLSRRTKDFLLSLFPSIRDRVETSLSFSGIRWSETKAFSEELRPNIWINLKDTRPQGTVHRSDYEPLREEIIAKALELTDPNTGQKVFEKAYKKEEIYHGPFLHRAPDILLVRKEQPYAYIMRVSAGTAGEPVRQLSTRQLHDDLRPNAGHRPIGLAIFRGKHIRQGVLLPRHHIYDIAPTVLYLLSLPIPSDMDGKLITSAIEPRYLQKNPPIFCQPSELPPTSEHEYSPQDAKTIEDQLRGLGYLE